MSWSGRKWSWTACTETEADEVAKYVSSKKVPEEERAYIEARNKRFGTALPPAARSVLALLGEWEAYREGYAWPSMRRMAECTGFALETVRKAVNELERRGLIFIYRPPQGSRRKNGRMVGSLYRLAVPECLRDSDKSWLPNEADGQKWDFLDGIEEHPGWSAWRMKWRPYYGE